MKKAKLREVLKKRAREDALSVIVALAEEEGKTPVEVLKELMLEHEEAGAFVEVTEEVVQAVATGIVEQAEEDGKTIEDVVNEIVDESKENEDESTEDAEEQENASNSEEDASVQEVEWAVTNEEDGNVHVRPVVEGEIIDTTVEQVEGDN